LVKRVIETKEREEKGGSAKHEATFVSKGFRINVPRAWRSSGCVTFNCHANINKLREPKQQTKYATVTCGSCVLWGVAFTGDNVTIRLRMEAFLIAR
jgi:hypothetical protein